ncbi:serine protease [uncultured Rhodoblastus sp.]|uniref:trypsin-like serine peptidase n=1 Tax=uncultured Rhodoblastus sp. TaxID=543037 RepID=UPI0025EF74A3|nr:serine protease [uncultured Rhodoblastus sp.]
MDWDKKIDSSAVSHSLFLVRGKSARDASGLEGIEEAAPLVLSDEERIERLEAALAAERESNPGQDRAAQDSRIVASARQALAKSGQGEPLQNFTVGDNVGLESVILTDGTRPSLFIQEGFVDVDGADIGDWGMGLSRFEPQIRKVVASVGRIDIPQQPWFEGTCFVVAEGLVLTNRHVLETIAAPNEAGGWILKWPDQTTVNFSGEFESAHATKFRIVGVAFAGPDAINRTVDFTHLDIAILKVDPGSDPGNVFPPAVTFEKDSALPKRDRNLYVLGFPGQPYVWRLPGAPGPGSETAQVIADTFKSRFGYKRLAPGALVAGPGEVLNDAKKWILAHDASTLGGNSGSCVVDLGVDGFRILGLHFAGASRQQNWAHVMGAIKDQLAACSATFVA